MTVLAVIGTRHVHARGLAELAHGHGATVVGAWEPDAAAAEQWPPQLGPIVDDRAALLARADAVIVAGTNADRARHVVEALDAGCHVLTEKPVAATESDLELLRTLDPEHADRVSVALPVRFAPALQQAKAMIEAGAIGVPVAGRGTNHGQYPGGWFGRLAEAGGGAIMDHTVHVADALCWLLGDRIVRVQAEAVRRLHDDIDVEDCGVLLMDFASGLFASLDASWSRPRTFPVWGDVWIELVGTEGRLVVDPMARTIRHFDDRSGAVRAIDYGGEDMTSRMMRQFLRFVRGEVPPPVTLAEGIHASEVVFAAYRSLPEPVAR